ncbi:hypothetical protein [Microbispora rosea]|uniref:hypothetical protein n=1 Tax=Microbispora rosea TaxID=58117 RepID=UPI0037947304
MLTELLCGVAGAITGGAALAATAALRLHDERAIHRAAATTASIRLEAAQRERDTALDALHRLVQALESTGEYEVEHALDTARWVLQGGDYTGRLTAALTALDEVVQELADVRAHAEAHGIDLTSFAEHADQAIAVVHDHADRIEPAGALHHIRQLISRKHRAC